MLRILGAPSEPAEAIEELDAIVSSLPEEVGADYLIYSNHGVWGAQRKEFPWDFTSSFSDGRLTKETTRLVQLDFFEIIIEGAPRYDDGMLRMREFGGRKYSEAQIEHMLMSLKFVKGTPVTWTSNIHETAKYIKLVASFFEEEKHTSLFRMPKPKGQWGIRTADDKKHAVLQSFEGVGPSLADNILHHFHGRLPLKWTCAFDELLLVRNIGHSRATKLWQTLED